MNAAQSKERFRIFSHGHRHMSSANTATSASTVTVSVVSPLLKLFTSLLDVFPASITIPSNPNATALLKAILTKAPSTLVEPFEMILKDGTLTSSDIPAIVLLVSKLHNETFHTMYDANMDTVLDLIQLLVHAIIDTDYVKVEKKEAIYGMLDASVALLKMQLTMGVPAVRLRSCC